MARVALTDSALELIGDARGSHFFTDAETEQLDVDIDKGSLGLSSLQAVKRYIASRPENGKSLASCFASQKAVLQFPSKAETLTFNAASTSLRKERMDHLTRLQETKEYNRMVFGSCKDPVTEFKEKEMSSFVSYRHQASVGANVIISAGGMGLVFYFLSKSFFQKKQHVRV